jgi:SAM-dependent methyltransferase
VSEPNFQKYSAVYDLLYGDKDYVAEADYVAQSIRAAAPAARTILEFGSGTGRHGRLLAERGFEVYGIERSPDMVALAKASPAAPGSLHRFDCEVGDVRSVALHRRFDAVAALFHVISYQPGDDDLRASFAAAARHLVPGGVFLFDVWHGPAVLAQRPKRRVKKVGNDDIAVVRTASPHHDASSRTVKVVYDIECRDRRSGEIVRFSEDHVMRYLFPDEIEAFAASCGLRLFASEEFLTGRPPSDSTWGVVYLLRK